MGLIVKYGKDGNGTSLPKTIRDEDAEKAVELERAEGPFNGHQKGLGDYIYYICRAKGMSAFRLCKTDDDEWFTTSA